MRKSTLLAIVSLFAILAMAANAGGKKWLISDWGGKNRLTYDATYAKSQQDTLILIRSKGVDVGDTVTLGIKWLDSMKITKITMRKAFDGYFTGSTWDSVGPTYTATGSGGAYLMDYKLPYRADSYYFIVSYDTTTALFGVSTPTSRYSWMKR